MPCGRLPRPVDCVLSSVTRPGWPSEAIDSWRSSLPELAAIWPRFGRCVLSADVRVAKKSARRGGERPVTGDSGACGGTRGTTDRGGCGRVHRAGRLARRSATTRCLGGRAFGEQRGGITGPTVGCRRWPGGSGRGSGRAQRRGARRRHFSSRQGRSCLTHACRENPSRGVSGGIRVGRCGSVRRPSSKGWR